MLVFTHPDLVKGVLEHSIARKDGNQYSLVLSKPSGFVYDREISRLNVSTARSSKPLPLSPERRPFIWLDASTDRGYGGIPTGVIPALLATEPQSVIQLTGRTQPMQPPAGSNLEGGEVVVQQVELLLSEDELCHSCYYCGELEIDGNGGEPFQKIGGAGYTSTYGCSNVSSLPLLHKAFVLTFFIVHGQTTDYKDRVGTF